MNIEDPSKSPFTEKTGSPENRARSEAYETTMDMLARLDDYRRQLNEHLQEYRLPSDGITFDASDKRTISLSKAHRDNFHLEDTEDRQNGIKDQWSYEVNPTDLGPGRNSGGRLIHRIITETQVSEIMRLDFNQGLDFPVQKFHGAKVYGLEEDGLHVQSPEQLAWDRRWSEFQQKLVNNEKFYDFLDRMHHDKSVPWEIRLWANNLIRGAIEVRDKDGFIEEISDYWKQATGKSLPKKDIPASDSPKRPTDEVYNHATIQRDIQSEYQRLQDAVRKLDEHLLPDQGPYRTSGRDISKAT